MTFVSWRCGAMLSLSAAFALVAVGCGPADTKGDQAKGQSAKTGDTKQDEGHGWWCEDHGIPEAECSMCQAKVEKECKAKGDWCEMHDRAKSQCFICDPKLKEKFAQKYRDKYGKEPPPIPEEEKKDDKG